MNTFEFVITTFCLACMVAIIIGTIVKLSIANRAQRLSLLKNFKKGKFAIIYLTAIPLYWLSIARSGVSIGVAFFLAIRSSIELVVLKYDYNSVSALMGSSVFFSVTMYICFALVTLNAVIFAFALAGQGLSNYFRKIKTTKFAKKVYVVVGCSEQSKKIIKSISPKDGAVLLLSDSENSVADFAFIQKISYVKINSKTNVGELLETLFKKFDNKTVNVIVNTRLDDTDLIYVEQLSQVILKTNLCKYAIDDTRGLNVYVFGEPENASAFLHFAEKTKGCVTYVNKYKLIAMDFIDRFPITEFMDKQISSATATVNNDVDVNVALIGFGKTNQQIFLTSVANNQLLTLDKGVLTEKPINYYIYDQKDARNDKNLNHNYYRFINELEQGVEYLSLPQKPANEAFFELSINDKSFYKSVKDNLTGHNGNSAYNYVIIAFGTDMENLDFADKMSSKLKEWGLFDCTKIFVKIRDDVLAKEVINVEYAPESGILTFGNENEVVYNLSTIVNENKNLMARNRHLCYALTGDMTELEEQAAKESALKLWFSQTQVQRESNVYACLSIRMKLHLLGFDYVSTDQPNFSANDEYLETYQRNDKIIYDQTKPPVKGRRIIQYSNNFVNGSVRQTLAIQEHQRWNAYMISSGFVPVSVENIEKGELKNMTLRRHSNITTFAGLIKFRETVAEVTGRTTEETDVIRYDYQLMDDLVWLLDNAGYKIIKKEKPKKKKIPTK